MEGTGLLASRCAVFMIGIMFMTVGVALSTKAVLGTTCISSIPFVLNLGIGLSLGTTTLIFNTAVVVLQALIMGRLFKLTYLTQFVTLVIFSALCDVFSVVFDFVSVAEYYTQWALIVISTVTLAFGISLELAANISMMPGEYLVSFISFKTKAEFGKIKVIVDTSMIVIAAIMSLCYFGHLEGVREGTIFAAIAMGPTVKQFSKAWKRLGLYEILQHSENDRCRGTNPAAIE